MGKKTEFSLPYIGIGAQSGFDLLYGLNGEMSVVIQMVNPVQQYAASGAAYDEFHHLLTGIIKILGEGHFLQKLDVVSRSSYAYRPAKEYLQDQYNRHFTGRSYMDLQTYLVITRQVRKKAFYVYDKKILRDFLQAVAKVFSVLETGGSKPVYLREAAINQLTRHLLRMDFSGDPIVLDNLTPTDTEIRTGKRSGRNICLVDIDSIDLPSAVSSHIELNEKDTMKGFPVDFLSFLLKAPDADLLVYNQVIGIPDQQSTLNKLELKRKRHSGIPDPANNLCVEDIDLLLNDVARENQLLVNAHFNIFVAAPQERLQQAANYVERSLFQLGIIPCRNSYNQLELFRSLLPGNAVALQPYDLFLTTADAALCFFFKESLPQDEKSNLLIRFTDRQGIPVGIDPADLPMRDGRINNRNSFVLGPSGSGKSFFMNALVEQYMLYNTDIVIIDTGHSYSGLCAYYKGKYITYSDEKPITMNPFAMTEAEYNIEKKDFLGTLICLLWKGADGNVTPVERDVLSSVISGYYAGYFEKPEFKLNFNSFYDFAVKKIPEIREQEQISFDFDEFRYVLKKFYAGGEFAAILNEEADASLFTESFIVFEIDNIKEHKILFPIITLIIMDVFIQKMRHRQDRRKWLIAEEAWKAIASPIMAGYLLYLYKTVRKFWGAATLVTQELNDIIGNAIVKDSIINNSDTICLLDQSKFKDNYAAIAALLSITETERKKIFTINQLDNKDNRGRFKEVYIRRGSTGEVYGVEVSLPQYLCYTTEKPEKSAVSIYTDHYGDYPTALAAFVRDMAHQPLAEFVSIINSLSKPLPIHEP
jgi:conjugation system TraG family ATPase